MPTKEEQEELLKNCNWSYTTLNGKKGYLITSKIAGYTDCSIFLPFAGFRRSTDMRRSGYKGYYWSSSLAYGYTYDRLGYGIYLDSDESKISHWERFFGCSVRPVYR